MRLSETYHVPPELALLYDFVNTLDERRYMENGALHNGGDEISTPLLLAEWMRARSLLGAAARVAVADHRIALDLRQALREFLRSPPDQRHRAKAAAQRLTAASRAFPLAMAVSDTGSVQLVPVSGSNALGRVLAQMLGLAGTDRLDRLKSCACDECRWIFFDHSKPANRRWCSSVRCGNRQKGRTYRARRRHAAWAAGSISRPRPRP
jgi:predicted RNA-binding Zn ribbon-like protein